MDDTPLEKKIKELMDQRTIDPSPVAWDRLDAMLSIADNQKPKKLLVYLAIAASIAVFFTMSVWLSYKQSPATERSKMFVEHHPQASKIDTQHFINPSLVISPDYKNSDVKSETNSNVQVTKHFKNNSKKDISIGKYIEKSEETIPESSVANENINIEKSLAKTENIMVVTAMTENNNIRRVNIDSDQLLKNVESSSKISRQSVTVNKYGIDAKKLLWEAENVPEKKLISKIFKSIQENSGTVIAAVSERNQIKAK